MVKRLFLSLFLLILFIPISSQAWFSWSEEWGLVYIATANDQSFEPSGIDTAPDYGDGTIDKVSLPVTITVQVTDSDLWGVAVNYAELQYKVEGETNWITLDPVYDQPSNLSGTIDFSPDQQMFGSNVITEDLQGVDPGDIILVRLYIAHIENDEIQNKNANKSEDPTGEGSNSWNDPWVIRIGTEINQRPFWNIGW